MKIKFEKLEEREMEEVFGTGNISTILYEALSQVREGEGTKIGPFETEDEAKKIRPKVGVTTRTLGWDIGIKTSTGKKVTPYIADEIQDENGWYLRIVRKRSIKNSDEEKTSE